MTFIPRLLSGNFEQFKNSLRPTIEIKECKSM